MSQMIYEERCPARGSATMEPFIKALLPLLKTYGLPDGQQEFDHSHNCIVGNPDGARLEYIYNVTEGSDWLSPETWQTLTSHQLVHTITGETLSLFIEIHDVSWASNSLKMRFEGAADKVEEIKKAVQEARDGCT